MLKADFQPLFTCGIGQNLYVEPDGNSFLPSRSTRTNCSRFDDWQASVLMVYPGLVAYLEGAFYDVRSFEVYRRPKRVTTRSAVAAVAPLTKV